MVVQLNQKNTDEMTAQETVSRLLRMLENQEPMLEFSQQQYFSPIYSREWYKTQVVRRTFDLLGYSWASCPDFWAIPLILIFCLLLILSAILVYFLPPLHRFFVHRLPENPLVHIDFAQREITFWQNQKCIQKIELGLPSSLMYKQQPLCFSVNNKLIKLNIYDKNSKGHLLWQMETAVLFGKTEAKFLQQIDDLTGKMAKKLNLTLFYEKTSV